MTGDCGVTIACDQPPASFDDDDNDDEDDNDDDDYDVYEYYDNFGGDGDIAIAGSRQPLNKLHQMMAIM